MGSNLPPGVRESDPAAPWNQRDPEDYLPLVCDECGFRAETLEELDKHEHPRDVFSKPSRNGHDYCMVCSPPPDAHQRARHGGDALVFCDDHDESDFRNLERAKAKQRRQCKDRETDMILPERDGDE